MGQPEIEKQGKEEILKHFVDSSRRVVQGFSEEKLEESRSLIGEMVSLGRITEVQAEILESQLVQKMKRNRQLFDQQVSRIVEEVVQRLAEIATQEVAELSQRLDRFESTATQPTVRPQPTA